LRLLATTRPTVDQGIIALLLALGIMSAGAFAQAAQAVEPAQAAPAAQASEFSADIVSRDAAGIVIGAVAKLYVRNHMVRIETPEAPSGFLLINGDAGTAQFVRPAQRLFMEARQSSRLTQIFVPVDAKEPCQQWHAAASTAGVAGAAGEWRCERIEDEIIDGRRAVQFRVSSPVSPSSRRWIDSDLEFPVKLQTPDGTTIALEHIVLEAQPANRFALPPGFRNFDPQALIERVKHSDAWVAP
jgi:HPt (histidine-containing phosphotransfer) domain-containing protein